MMLIYNVILHAAAALALPFILLGLLTSRKWRSGLGERLGIMSRVDEEKIRGKKIIWFHAASVGEVQAMAPVIREIRNLKKGCEIVVTSTSVNGREKVKKELGADVMYSCLLPLDSGLFLRPFIDKISPEAAVIVETEFWPNFISCLDAAHVPMILMNGRISVKSYRLYHPLRFFFRPLLKKFSLIIVQSEKMLKRAKALGAREVKILILGNTKFSAEEGGKERYCLADKKGKKILIAGSIREGEERLVIDAFVLGGVKNLVLVVAPRRLKSVPLIKKLLSGHGLRWTAWSRLQNREDALNFDAVIVDTIGELFRIYGMGDAAIVGGGFKNFGGHNPMEPAAAGLPMIMGRHMHNFEDTTERFVKGGGAVQVDPSVEALAAAIKETLESEGASGYKVEKNRHIIEQFRGTAAATAVIINEIMIEHKGKQEVIK